MKALKRQILELEAELIALKEAERLKIELLKRTGKFIIKNFI